ncbi:uncharacterized protein LOC131429668 isoform X1 [Malaya genurostris]|uniref:uncharacterized protein LOC131429668 isoform X1 n=1 Tax=Malaya genurostris TaxID=325434 RepID=UPI0026F3930A|nr:uncharacterized protein LOC131429668 isoform X1 [Malaya genurostris]XP_058449935.1 uncharacterized protein LOC131429668 isoform X1 [Malaya genurostris]
MSPRGQLQFHNMLWRSNVGTRISIRDNIDKYRRAHPNKKPLVLVDLMFVDQIPIPGNNRDRKRRNICGPNLVDLEHYEHFFKFLQGECQADVVFFVDGPGRSNTSSDFNTDQRKPKDRRYENDINVIDMLTAENFQAIRKIQHIPTDRVLMDSIETLAKQYGTLWHSVQNKRYLEIAKYAQEMKAIAVLGKKCRFILLTEVNFWYLTHLDVTSMETIEIDPANLGQIGLETPEKRCLMATLLSKSFIFKWTATNISYLLNCLSVLQALPENIARQQYCDVARALFKDSYCDALVEDLIQSCEQQNLKSIQLSVQPNNLSTWEYDIISNSISNITIRLNDYRYWDAKGVKFSELLTGFYARAAGVLLTRKNQRTPQSRQLFIKQTHESFFNYHSLDVQYPDFKIMNSQLDAGTDLTEENINYLQFVFGVGDLPVERINRLINLHTWKLLDYITVYFMLKIMLFFQKKIMSSTIADSLLLAVENYSTHNAELDGIPPELDMEIFHVTFMYIRWRHYVRQSLIICGIPEALIDNRCRLDGVKVQNIYQNLRMHPEEIHKYDIGGFVQNDRFYD